MVTNYREGGPIKLEGRGAASEGLPLQKRVGGGGGVLAILKGGTKSCGVVLTSVLEVLTILEGVGHKQ